MRNHNQKLLDMQRSILPSKARKTARQRKAANSRAMRRSRRQHIKCGDYYYEPMNCINSIVNDRRDYDKVNHLERWFLTKVVDMNKREAADYANSLFGNDLIGRHAKSHLESAVYNKDRFADHVDRERERQALDWEKIRVLLRTAVYRGYLSSVRRYIKTLYDQLVDSQWNLYYYDHIERTWRYRYQSTPTSIRFVTVACTADIEEFIEHWNRRAHYAIAEIGWRSVNQYTQERHRARLPYKVTHRDHYWRFGNIYHKLLEYLQGLDLQQEST